MSGTIVELEVPPDLAATLVMVRHGESTYVAEGRFQGRHDPVLSELGRRQAALVAQRLGQPEGGVPLPIPAGPPHAIWHSPLRRAAQTARAIGGQLVDGVPLRPTPALTELAQGQWEGLHMDEVRSRWPAELAAWRRSPATAHAPGGEPLPAGGRRVADGLREVLAELMAGSTAAGAPLADGEGAEEVPRYDPVPGYPSPAPLRSATEPWAVLVAHDGIFRLTLMILLRLPLERFWSLPFNLCSISVLAIQQGVATLRAHNLSDHLAPLADDLRAAEEARGERRGAL